MPKKEGYVQVPVCELHGLAVSSLRRANVPPEEAEIIAESLVEADQRGVYTHGCVCLPRYIGLMNGGHMRAAAEYRVLRQTDAIAVWDGMRSSGQVLGNWAMKEAMRQARTHGIGAVAVKGSNHFGAGAYYAQLAQKEGMIGIAMSTGSSTMAPWGGADRLIGNNPVAVAVPAEKHVPVVLDMAQSVVAFGRITNMKKEGKTEIPAGWALDKDGVPTQKIDDVYTVLPMQQHKGFGTALIVDILAGILFGGATGNRAGDDQEGPGCLFIAIDIDSFGDRETFLKGMDARIDELKGSKIAPWAKAIYMPGEIENNNMNEAADTVWMMPQIVDDLRNLPR